MAREKSGAARKPFGFRLDFELVKVLKILAIEQNRAVNVLLEEAIKDLLKKYTDRKRKKVA